MLDPVILFFILGAIGGLSKSDLKIPESFYEVLSIYLLLSIGIKGGLELAHSELSEVVIPAIGTIVLGASITVLAYFILDYVLDFKQKNAIAIAIHYGSVSAVTFAVVLSYLETQGVKYEEFMTVLLVLLETPAIIVGVFMARLFDNKDKSFKKRQLLHEVFVSKSILLMIGGLGIGIYIGYSGNQQLNSFFLDLFKGFLAIFMLQMGIVASSRIADLKKAGLQLIIFGIFMPLISACLGAFTAWTCGLDVGGATVLATLAASASYIAAPAAVKIAIPEASLTYCLTASLGITFPFNIIFGIPLYYTLIEWLW